MSQTLFLDAGCGISGDMMVAALLDLGADEQVLRSALASLPVDGYEIAITRVLKSGIDACDFNVILDAAHENHDHDMEYLYGHTHHAHAGADARDEEHHHHEHAGADAQDEEHHHHEHAGAEACDEEHHHHEHAEAEIPEHHDHTHVHAVAEDHGHDSAEIHEHLHHGHGEHDHAKSHNHEHHHHGRGLPEIQAILRAGSLTPGALAMAEKIFGIVAQAESKVHAKALNEVHFHEVGAVDSIVDIAAVAVCLDNLQIDRVIIPSLAEGTGSVRCQHGLLPIPVPATAAIAAMYQLPLQISGIQGELVTPTGAAVAAAVMTDTKLPEHFTIQKIGIGAGKRTYENAGILRAMLIKDIDQTDDTPTEIVKLETNMDDCTGEAMGFLLTELMDMGALDAFYQPIFMKKNRPGYLLSVLCRREDQEKLEQAIFHHTTTIGIRRVPMQRTKLPRIQKTIHTEWGEAVIKYTCSKGEVFAYPEYNSVAALAKAQGAGFSDMYHLLKAAGEAEKPEASQFV